MTRLTEKYLIDENGNKIGVVLEQADYEKIREDFEELNAIRAYDVAKQPVNGKAQYIITGDKDLLVLNPFREINIIKPDEFIEIN